MEADDEAAPAQGQGVAERAQGAAVLAGFDEEESVAEGGGDAVARQCGERLPGRLGMPLGDCRGVVPEGVGRGIAGVGTELKDAGRQDEDGRAAGFEGTLVGRGVDAVGVARDDGPSERGEAAGDGSGDLAAVVGRLGGSDDPEGGLGVVGQMPADVEEGRRAGEGVKPRG